MIINVNGTPFEMSIVADDNNDAPWLRSDTHGPVRCVSRVAKGPHELILGPSGSRDYWYLYDAAKAQQIALRDGWGADTNEPDRGYRESKRQRAARAVRADFEYLRGWVQDEWQYVGVVVIHTASGSGASLWGIESEGAHPAATAYHMTVAHELAEEITQSATFEAWRERIKAREDALDMADHLRSIATDTLYPTTLCIAARLLETLARGTE